MKLGLNLEGLTQIRVWGVGAKQKDKRARGWKNIPRRGNNMCRAEFHFWG